MKKIAITGGIGSGKSLACQWLADNGYPVFSCDTIYKEVIVSPSYVAAVEKQFPLAVFQGEIDRKKLGNIVFQNPTALKKLNEISHPLIMQELEKKINAQTAELVFAEVPLLFEGHFENRFDYIIVITRNKQSRIQQIMQRDGLSLDEAQERMAAQFDYDSPQAQNRFQDDKIFSINNNGSILQLQESIRGFIDRFK